MKQVISAEKVEATFRQQLARALPRNVLPTPIEALEIMVAFYQEYTIEGLDSDAESDMMLAELGIYGLPDGEGPQFQCSFVRQFLLDGEEEFYQLNLTLYFDRADFEGVTAFGEWSCDFASLGEWITTIQADSGFQQAVGGTPHFCQVRFDQT